jgi:SHS2 domain-containing protein
LARAEPGRESGIVYRFLEHTAELGLEVEAASFEELLSEAARAFAELVAPGSSGAPASHTIELGVVHERTLLADWLNELVFLAETEAFVPERITSSERLEDRLRIEIAGFEDAPRPLVKAVTYHGLELDESADGTWKGRVVLDV